MDKGLRPIRNLLSTRSGRGEDAPTLKRLEAASGEIVDLEPGAKPRLNRPVVEVKPHASGTGHEVRIEIGTEKHIEWALAELRKKLPGAANAITADMIRQHGKRGKGYIQGPVKLQIVLGGSDYARGILKSCFNLLAAHGGPALDACFDPLREFVLNGNGASENFLRWPTCASGVLPQLGPADHFLGLVSRENRVEGVVQLFGGILHSVCLTKAYAGPALKLGYLVDPLREADPAENRNPQFLDDSILVFDAQPDKPGPETWAAAEKAFNIVGEVFKERTLKELTSSTLQEVWAPGTPLTDEVRKEFASRLAKRIVRIEEN